MDASIATHLQLLEEQLLRYEVRKDPQEVSALLTEDFREFGSSGRSFTKPEILASLASESQRQLTLSDFQCQQIAPEVALVTYRSTSTQEGGPTTQALRSSLWVYRDNRWQMLFHQGTRIPQPPA